MAHSINSLVPNRDAELALLWELFMCGGECDTGYIVKRAMAHFPVLKKPKEANRQTPNGRPWWEGRFRFDLSRLGRHNEAIRIKHGTWRITEKGKDRLNKAGYRREKEFKIGGEKEKLAMSELTLTEKLMDLWALNTEGNKAEMSQQLSERVFGILSLIALPETKPIFDQLYTLIDFDRLCEMIGCMSISGFWGKDALFEPF